MLEYVNHLVSILESGSACAVATIIDASGSVPRPAGTSMLVSGSGAVTGSLSGGCVEAAVVEAALSVLGEGRARTETFGFNADDAFAVGLSCGGTLEVLVQPFYPAAGPGTGLLLPDGGRAAAVVRRADGEGGAVVVGDSSAPGLEAALEGIAGAASAPAAEHLRDLMSRGFTGTVHITGSPLVLFLESRQPAPRLYLVGANDFSAALSAMAHQLGYRVTVCDARPAFTSRSRFPDAEEVAVQWPDTFLRERAEDGELDANSLVCVLTHDAKFDLPVLEYALQRDLAYVGAMGSRRSHAQRMAALRAAGVSEDQLTRLHSPIGLDIGALTPAEVAVSILAHMVAVRNGNRSGAPLTAVSGPLHPVGRHSAEIAAMCAP